jgi:predicted aminopeptidase
LRPFVSGSRRSLPFRIAAFGVVVLVLLVSGCSAGYVLRAGYEEAKILWRREPIADVLARADLDGDVRRKLETVLAAREFATSLGLDVDGSFASVSYTDREANIFVLTGAKRTALEPYTWWFPIVGKVPYKGYFDPDLAHDDAAALEAQGYDTFIRTAAAFSTLGWFADPLLRHLLRHDEGFLVNLVLHEVYHNTFYVSGQSAFNESVATFAGHRGAIDFFRSHPERAHPPGGGDLAARAESEWEDTRRFGAFVGRLATLLRGAYADAADAAQAVAARDALFARAREEYAALPFAVGGFPRFINDPLNNAVLLHYLLYATELDLFEAAYSARGRDLAASLAFIKEAAKRDPKDPFGALRRALDAERSIAVRTYEFP